MYFDLHSDILYDIVQKKLDNKQNIIKDWHLNDLLRGNFYGGIWAFYTDIENRLCDFNQAIELIVEELEQASDYINLVKSKDEFVDDKLNIILGLEGLSDVKDVTHMGELYDLGFRHAMLTWNEENHFATGILGSRHRGLTDSGKELIDYMTNNKMIIDVSHANRQTFDDISEQTNAPLLASHSNIYRLYPHIRNLKDEQVNTIVETNGLIGLTAVSHFLKDKRASIDDLMLHLNYFKQSGILDHVGFGFDFMYYMNEDLNLVNLKHPRHMPNLTHQLMQHGYNATEIKKITCQNTLDFINRAL